MKSDDLKLPERRFQPGEVVHLVCEVIEDTGSDFVRLKTKGCNDLHGHWVCIVKQSNRELTRKCEECGKPVEVPDEHHDGYKWFCDAFDATAQAFGDDAVESVWQRIYDRYGRRDCEPQTHLIDVWAEGHADYDHYIQDCRDCQKVWIRMVLDETQPSKDRDGHTMRCNKPTGLSCTCGKTEQAGDDGTAQVGDEKNSVYSDNLAMFIQAIYDGWTIPQAAEKAGIEVRPI